MKKNKYFKEKIFLFWDTRSQFGNHPYILGEDGNFYFYSEDSVAIDQGCESGRSWTILNKFTDRTPLNENEGYDIFDPISNEWVSWKLANKEIVAAVHRHAGDPEWEYVY